MNRKNILPDKRTLTVKINKEITRSIKSIKWITSRTQQEYTLLNKILEALTKIKSKETGKLNLFSIKPQINSKVCNSTKSDFKLNTSNNLTNNLISQALFSSKTNLITRTQAMPV